MGKALLVYSFQKPLDIAKSELDVLKFWDETHAFEGSVSSRPESKKYVFYDGPPFATGLPHYGHILASTIKDVIPRYWTMKGYRVERVWGWDCHGIPIESMIEKELELKGGKKGIELLGIDKFNAACRSAILRFDSEWEKVIRRIGRWVDFKHSYKTMDKTYMESVWWAFSTLYKKGMIYEGRRVILYCPRCATPLSNFEIAMDNSYKDVEDNSVYVKFRVRGKKDEYFVAWTTTPWTLIGNVGLAVSADAEYVLVDTGQEKLWMAEERVHDVLSKNEKNLVVQKVKGKELAGMEYEPLYTYMPLDGKKSHYVALASFVSLSDGTGIVHTAAIYGEDDYTLAVELDLPRVPTLDDQGKFLPFVTPLADVFYKKSEAWIIEDLTKRNLMLATLKIVHSYPFCYRCETPLYYSAVPAWFINVAKMKKDLLAQNEHIHWYPGHLKHGRFGKGLETAPDWNISRSRYWGTPMPIWKSSAVSDQSSAKDQYRIIGSIDELKKWAVKPDEVEKLTDIHREFIDDIEIWMDDARTIKGQRIPEVFDCWVESGSMPYASIHYPFEHIKEFEASHPSQFIAEYIAQTRAWFYTLHVMSVGLFGKNTFENAVTTGTILAEDGSKMSKSKKNFPDPSILFEKYGVDALRFYLMGSVVMKAENLNFSEISVKEIYQKLLTILWNVFSFYKLYAKAEAPSEGTPKAVHDMDKWIVSKTHTLIQTVTASMDAYDTNTTCRTLQEFVTDLSNWYLRRSRERLKESQESRNVFGWVIRTLVLLLSPLVPFLTEKIYQNLGIGTGTSIHLASWPVVEESFIDKKLEHAVEASRNIVETLLALRKNLNIPVRQPLSAFFVKNCDLSLVTSNQGVLQSILDETNIESLEEFSVSGGLQSSTSSASCSIRHIGDGEVFLNTKITQDLKEKGMARELLRKIQTLRKEKECTIDAHISLVLPNEYKAVPEKLMEKVKTDALVDSFIWGDSLQILTG